METIKLYWKRFVVGIAATLAAVTFAYLVFRKHLGEGLGQYLKDEAGVKDVNRKKLEEQTERLKKEKEDALKKEEEQKQQKLKKAEELVKEEKNRLLELEKTNKSDFESELKKQLGVVEKKKGRPKRNGQT